MDKLTIQDVYTTIAMEGSPLYNKIQELVSTGYVEKKSNMIVLTPEQFEKAIQDAKKQERIRFVEAYDRAKKLNEELKWD